MSQNPRDFIGKESGLHVMKHKGKWKTENCQLFQLGTALDFQSPIFGFEVF